MNKGYNPYRDPSNGRFTTGPSTVNKENQKDKNIKYDEGEAARLNKYEKAHLDAHKIAVEKLKSAKYEDGTYDIETLKTVDFKNGYQVSFWQIGDNYSSGDYNKIASEMTSASSNGKAYAGKFGGDPEISYHVANREQAISLARKYNQISIWDWEKCDEIKTGGTGRRK